MDIKKTLDVIKKMQLAKIGDYKKWEKITRKLTAGKKPNNDELQYFAKISRIYKNANVTNRSKIFHTKLSPDDKKPPCKSCGGESLYYCNMNDDFYCMAHVVGHDENE